MAVVAVAFAGAPYRDDVDERPVEPAVRRVDEGPRLRGQRRTGAVPRRGVSFAGVGSRRPGVVRRGVGVDVRVGCAEPSSHGEARAARRRRRRRPMAEPFGRAAPASQEQPRGPDAERKHTPLERAPPTRHSKHPPIVPGRAAVCPAESDESVSRLVRLELRAEGGRGLETNELRRYHPRSRRGVDREQARSCSRCGVHSRRPHARGLRRRHRGRSRPAMTRGSTSETPASSFHPGASPPRGSPASMRPCLRPTPGSTERSRLTPGSLTRPSPDANQARTPTRPMPARPRSYTTRRLRRGGRRLRCRDRRLRLGARCVRLRTGRGRRGTRRGRCRTRRGRCGTRRQRHRTSTPARPRLRDRGLQQLLPARQRNDRLLQRREHRGRHRLHERSAHRRHAGVQLPVRRVRSSQRRHRVVLADVRQRKQHQRAARQRNVHRGHRLVEILPRARGRDLPARRRLARVPRSGHVVADRFVRGRARERRAGDLRDSHPTRRWWCWGSGTQGHLWQGTIGTNGDLAFATQFADNEAGAPLSRCPSRSAPAAGTCASSQIRRRVLLGRQHVGRARDRGHDESSVSVQGHGEPSGDDRSLQSERGTDQTCVLAGGNVYCWGADTYNPREGDPFVDASICNLELLQAVPLAGAAALYRRRLDARAARQRRRRMAMGDDFACAHRHQSEHSLPGRRHRHAARSSPRPSRS